MLDADARALAATLAHELTHAWEHSQGLVPRTGAACFEAELRAFRAQAGVWERLYGPNGKEKPADELETEHNEVQRLLRDDLDGLKARLVNRYGDQCGYLGPRPTIVARPTGAAAGQPGRDARVAAREARRRDGRAGRPTAAPGKGPAAPAKGARPVTGTVVAPYRRARRREPDPWHVEPDPGRCASRVRGRLRWQGRSPRDRPRWQPQRDARPD